MRVEMTPAQKRKQELEAYKAQFLKLVAAGRSSEAVHVKAVATMNKQLRCEILQDRKRSQKPMLCDGCLDNYADPPSNLCPGCQAYREHQQ
jgi:hypothetical protein